MIAILTTTPLNKKALPTKLLSKYKIEKRKWLQLIALMNNPPCSKHNTGSG